MIASARLGCARLLRAAALIIPLLFLASAPASTPALADPGDLAGTPPTFPAEYAKPISGWNKMLERIELSLDAETVADSTLEAARAKLDDARIEIKAFVVKLRPDVEAARAQAEKLGKSPGKEEPAEPDAVTRQRAEVAKTLSDLSAAEKAAESALVKAHDLAGQVRDIRRAQFERRVLRRVPSPLSPSLWSDVARNMAGTVKQLGRVLGDWWQRTASKFLFLAIVFLSVGLWVGLTAGATQSVDRYRRWDEDEQPPIWRRSASAAWVILLRALPPFAAATFLYTGLTSFELLPPPAAQLAFSIAVVIGIIGAVQAVAQTVLAIKRPQWRLLELSDDAAARLYRRLLFLATLYGLDIAVSTFSHVASLPYSLSIVQSFLGSVGIAALIISILRIEDSGGGEGALPGRIGPGYVRGPLWLVALAILGAALTGYVALARFIAGQLIVTGTIAVIAYLCLIWAGAFGYSFGDDHAWAGRWLNKTAGLTQRRREQLALPVSLLLKGLVFLVAVPAVLLMWGFDLRDVWGWFEKVLFGFEVGTMRFSLTTVVLAVVIFVITYTGGRTFQSWLDVRVMEPAGIEESVRDSVRTGVGYLGVGIAAALAVSYAGFDLSNLALVAGALSVGLGFGMQSIVANFVSGLILLAERPIKVGDWVVVGTDEGTVRHIRVRATEIETFDRSSVIIPNSQLISQTVKNWTLHNPTGRVQVTVGVHYDSDPEEVRDILLEVANAHPLVLSTPEPFVHFSDFGNSALTFDLYAYLSNVRQSFGVRTDLRIGILKVFRARGIEIPYPQTDVHLRDLDWIKRAVMERVAKGRAESAASAASTVKEFDADSDTEDAPDIDGEGSNGGSNGA